MQTESTERYLELAFYDSWESVRKQVKIVHALAQCGDGPKTRKVLTDCADELNKAMDRLCETAKDAIHGRGRIIGMSLDLDQFWELLRPVWNLRDAVNNLVGPANGDIDGLDQLREYMRANPTNLRDGFTVFQQLRRMPRVKAV